MTAAQKRAFRKMRAGLARWKRAHGRRRKARKPRRGRHRRRNPIPGAMMEALVVNPSRKRRRKGHGRGRKHARRRNHARRGHRRNPSHRRRRHGYRRNPIGKIGGVLKNVLGVGVPAVIGGGVTTFVDGKVAERTDNAIVRTLVKVGVAVGGGMLARRFGGDRASTAFMAASLGTIGSDIARKFSGGMVAPTKKAGMKELAAMAAQDEEMGALLTEELRGLGVLVEGLGDEGSETEGMGDAADMQLEEYAQAISDDYDAG